MQRGLLGVSSGTAEVYSEWFEVPSINWKIDTIIPFTLCLCAFRRIWDQ